jgi:arsenate reductase
MKKIKVLFVCIHNSARSQMAEAFLNAVGEGKYVAESAGLEPGILNPLVVQAMHEVGIDISKNRTKDVTEFFDQKKQFDCVITVCDDASAERCPVFPGGGKRLHWSFRDPSSATGSHDEKMAITREVRDQIKKRIEDFLLEQKATSE